MIRAETRYALIEKACDALNRHDLAGFSEVFDESVITIDPSRGNPVGRDHAGSEIADMLIAFPDLAVELEEVIECGDRTVSLFTLSGINTGSWRGHAPSGRAAHVPICRVGEWIDGRVVTVRTYWDEHSLLRQLGLAVQ